MANERFGTDKDVEELIRRARRAGWVVTIDGGTHLRWDAPGGGGFRCALTGGSSVLPRVRSQLRRLDPDVFGPRRGRPTVVEESPPAEPPRPSIPPVRLDLEAELAALTGIVEELAGHLAAAGAYGDPEALAHDVRSARASLREVEDRLRERTRAARRAGRAPGP